MAAMVGAATLVSTGAYMFLRKEEENDFVKSVSIWHLINRIQRDRFALDLSCVETHTIIASLTFSTWSSAVLPVYQHCPRRCGIPSREHIRSCSESLGGRHGCFHLDRLYVSICDGAAV
jgi:hypothetical protein